MSKVYKLRNHPQITIVAYNVVFLEIRKYYCLRLTNSTLCCIGFNWTLYNVLNCISTKRTNHCRHMCNVFWHTTNSLLFKICLLINMYIDFGGRIFFRPLKLPLQAASSAKMPDTIAHGKLAQKVTWRNPEIHVDKRLCYSKDSYDLSNISGRKIYPKGSHMRLCHCDWIVNVMLSPI